MKFVYTALQLMLLCTAVDGHARLVEPPSRSSMWRFGFNNPSNPDDQGLFCGGKPVQWEQHGGKCGVCGDNFGDNPRANEPGGKYANGIIVRTYKPGELIKATVEITANHKGYFEFRLCQNDDVKAKVKQDCFDKNLLVGEDGQTTRFPIVSGLKEWSQLLKLPQDVQCKDCVFQWRYTSGNNWGTDPDGTQCLGCGKEQETFQACADVAIKGDTAPPETDTQDTETSEDDWEEDEDWEENEESIEDSDANANCDCVAAATPAVCHYAHRWSNRH